MLCNEHGSRYMILKEFEKANTLLEKGKLFASDNTKASIMSNFGCYYEKISETQSAIDLIEETIKVDKNNATKNQVGLAISFNNKSVLEMK
jgi:tetratricopeptide (TPR) repeat protein